MRKSKKIYLRDLSRDVRKIILKKIEQRTKKIFKERGIDYLSFYKAKYYDNIPVGEFY